jgi:hypothetical protein
MTSPRIAVAGVPGVGVGTDHGQTRVPVPEPPPEAPPRRLPAGATGPPRGVGFPGGSVARGFAQGGPSRSHRSTEGGCLLDIDEPGERGSEPGAGPGRVTAGARKPADRPEPGEAGDTRGTDAGRRPGQTPRATHRQPLLEAPRADRNDHLARNPCAGEKFGK